MVPGSSAPWRSDFATRQFVKAHHKTPLRAHFPDWHSFTVHHAQRIMIHKRDIMIVSKLQEKLSHRIRANMLRRDNNVHRVVYATRQRKCDRVVSCPTRSRRRKIKPAQPRQGRRRAWPSLQRAAKFFVSIPRHPGRALAHCAV